MAEQLTAPAYEDFIAQARGAGKDPAAAHEVYFEAYVRPQFADKDVSTARAAFDQRFVPPEIKAPTAWDTVKDVGAEGFKGVRRGLNTLQQGALGYGSKVAHNYLPDAAGEYMDRQVRENADEIRSLQPSVTRQTALDSPLNTAKYVAGSVGEIAGQLVPNMVAGAMTGGVSLIPSTAVTTFGNAQASALTRQDVKGATEQLQSWEQATGNAPLPKEGLPVDLRKSYQGIDDTTLAVGAGLSTGLELAGLKFMPSAIRAKLEGKEAVDLVNDAVGGVIARTFKAGGKAAAGEGTTEFLQTYPEKFAEGAGLSEVFSPQTYGEAKDAAVNAAVGSGIIGGAGVHLGGGPRSDVNISNGIQSEGLTQEDELNAMRGPLPQAPAPTAPTKTPEEIAAEEKAAKVADIKSVQDLVPTAFTPPKPKKGETPDPGRLLTYPEFEKEAKKAWNESVPKPDPVAINQAYTEALKVDPTLDYKAFEKATIAQEQKAHAESRPQPQTQDIRPAYLKYVAMHEMGIRDFNEAYAKIDEEMSPNSASDVFDPAIKGATSPLIGQQDAFGGGGVGQTDLFGAPPGADMTDYSKVQPTLPEPEVPSKGVQLQLQMDPLALPAPRSDKLVELAAAMERGDFGPVHPNAIDALLKAAIADQEDAQALNQRNAPKEPAPAPNLPPMPPAVKPALPFDTLPGAGLVREQPAPAAAATEVTPPPQADMYQAPPAAAAPKPPKKPGKGTKIDPETDDLILAIRRLGGINVDLESDFKGRLNSISTPRIAGLPNVERTGGKGRSLDDLATVLHEHGYLANPDVSELYQKLWDAESKPQWSMQKQDYNEEQADLGTDRWIEQIDRANSEDEIVSIARAAGEDPRFQARFARDAEFQKQWATMVDAALESVAPVSQAPSPVTESQDLFPAADAETQATADQMALKAAQDEQLRKSNATQAPQGGGLFDLDNRQTEIGDLNAATTGQRPADETVPGTQSGVSPVAAGERGTAVPSDDGTRGRDSAGTPGPAQPAPSAPGPTGQSADLGDGALNDGVLEQALPGATGPVSGDVRAASPEARVESGSGSRNLPAPDSSRGQGDGQQNADTGLVPFSSYAPREQEALRSSHRGYNIAGRRLGKPDISFEDFLAQSGIQYSQGDTPRQGTTPEAITGILGDSPRIQVHKTLADAEKATGRKLKGNAKAFVLNGKAHFIADRIAPGSELGVFLHEVGAHLGMERILSKEQIDRLVSQVQQWAKSGKGVEQAAAKAAMQRSGGDSAETIAYFIEEAVNRGVQPTDMKSPMGRWLGQVWRAVKNALSSWGFKGAGKMSGQDLVDFAYGAAKMEMRQAGSGTGEVRYSGQKQTETPAFKKWFGDSKVVDGRGEPKVVYHGTPNVGHTTFDTGAVGTFFSERFDVAASYAGRANEVEFDDEGAYTDDMQGVYDAYLSIQNPLVIDFQGKPWGEGPDGLKADDWAVRARSRGYDGLIIENVEDTGFLSPGLVEDAGGGTVYVVFSPNQIKSAIGNNGEFDANNPDIRYSLEDTAKDFGKNILLAIQDAPINVGTKAMLLLNNHQIADFYKDLPSAKRYAEAVDAMQAEAGKNEERIGALAERMRKLPSDMQNRLSDLMTKSTLEGVHVDKAFEDPANAHLDVLKGQDNVHAALQERYQAMSPEAQAIYQEMRDHFAEMWKTRIQGVKDFAARIGVTGTAMTKLETELAQLSRKVKGPYFPLMREGKYVVVWKSKAYLEAEKNEDTDTLDKLKESSADYWVRFTDSEKEAKLLSTNRPERMADGAFGQFKLRTEASKEVNGAGAEFMSKLETALNERIKDKDTKEVALNALKQVFMETLPDLSVMKRTMMRRGVAGVRSDDMVRAIAKAGIADAHYLARLTHADRITGALQDLRLEDADPRPGEEIEKGAIGKPQGGIGRAYNLIAKSYRGDMMRPANEGLAWAANRLVEISYLHSLAMDTGNLIANMTQPALTVLPMLGGRHGFMKAQREMWRGLADAWKVAKVMSYALDVDKVTNKNGERDALKTLRDMGVVELSMSRDLASVGRGDSLLYDNIRKHTALPAHFAETITRISSVLAAYRLELDHVRKIEQGMSEEARRMKAIHYAAGISRDALVDFTPGGAPILMKGNHEILWKTTMQYKRFAIAMLWLYGRTVRDSIDASNIKNRTEARKILSAMLFAQFTIAGGLAGLPAALPAKLVAHFWPTDDEDESAEHKLNRLADLLAGGNPEISMALRKGPLSALTGADLSRKMGLADLMTLNQSQAFEPLKPNEKPGDRILRTVIPQVRTIDQIYAGTQAISDGDLLGGVAKIMPHNFLTDLYLAREAAEKGMMSKDKTSRISPLEYQTRDLVAKSLGIPPLLETLKWEAAEVATSKERPKMDRREKALDTWVIAAKDGDKEAMDKAQAKIDEFNASLTPEFEKYRIKRQDQFSRKRSSTKGEKKLTETGIKETKKNKAWLPDLDIYKPLR